MIPAPPIRFFLPAAVFLILRRARWLERRPGAQMRYERWQLRQCVKSKVTQFHSAGVTLRENPSSTSSLCGGEETKSSMMSVHSYSKRGKNRLQDSQRLGKWMSTGCSHRCPQSPQSNHASPICRRPRPYTWSILDLSPHSLTASSNPGVDAHMLLNCELPQRSHLADLSYMLFNASITRTHRAFFWPLHRR